MQIQYTLYCQINIPFRRRVTIYTKPSVLMLDYNQQYREYLKHFSRRFIIIVGFWQRDGLAQQEHQVTIVTRVRWVRNRTIDLLPHFSAPSFYQICALVSAVYIVQ